MPEFVIEGGAAVRVEMGGGFVEQQQGRRAIAACAQGARRGEDQSDQEGLLLAGRGVACGRVGGAVDDDQV